MSLPELPEGWTTYSSSKLEALFSLLQADASEFYESLSAEMNDEQEQTARTFVTSITEVREEIKGRQVKKAEKEFALNELKAALAAETEEVEKIEDAVEAPVELAQSEEVTEAAPDVAEVSAEELAIEIEETEAEELAVTRIRKTEVSEELIEEEIIEDPAPAAAAAEVADSAELSVEDETAEEVTEEVAEIVEAEELAVEVKPVEAEEVIEAEAEELAVEAEDIAEDVEAEELAVDVEQVEADQTDQTEEIIEELSIDLEVEAEAETEIAETSDTELQTAEDSKENFEMAKTEGAANAPEFYTPVSKAADSNLVASVGALTKQPGQPFENYGELAQEALALYRKSGGDSGWRNLNAGFADKLSFASASFEKDDDDFMLSMVNEHHNHEVFSHAIKSFQTDIKRAFETDDVLVASGGVCAPLNTDYSFFRLAEPQSPVEQALPRVPAPRGGIKFILPPDFTDAAAGITVVTHAMDVEGYEGTPVECGGPGDTPNKPCVCVECPEVSEVFVNAIPWCVRWGNFNYYTFPELVENFMRDLQVNYAKVKEVHYLNAILAASTVVTSGPSYSAFRGLLWDWRTAAANYRRRHNMAPDAVLQVMAPSWILDVIRQDLANSQWGSDPLAYLRVSDEQIRQTLRSIGVQVSLYYDTPTALPGGVPSQAFNQAQGAGVLNQFPGKAVSFMFAPGTFVRLDAMNLDFGMVRDSSLIATNDFIIAAEQFTSVAKVGLESLAIVSEICAHGAGGFSAPLVCDTLGTPFEEVS